MESLTNKSHTVLVTGTSSGIGRGLCQALIEKGYKVFGTVRNKKDAIELKKEFGENFDALLVDVTDEKQVVKAKEKVKNYLGRKSLTALINNAGIAVFDDPLKLSEEDWKKCFSVDLDGVWYGCQHTLPYMLEKKKGSIVNIASVHSFQIIPNCFPYPVAKHGVLGLTRALAVDYANKGIKINSISPGYIFTPINEWFFNTKPDPAAAKKEAEMLHPINRLGASEEIANAALFMSSDECNFMIGANVVIDGGLTLKIHDN